MVKKVKKVKTPLRSKVAPARPVMPSSVDGLLMLVCDRRTWEEDDDRPERAVALLAAQGESVLVAEAFLALVRDDAAFGDDAVAAVAEAVGEHVEVGVGDTLLDGLDAGLVRGWLFVVDVLMAFVARGWKSERLWPWLERLRAEEPGLWTVHAPTLGDRRAVPLLQKMSDDAEEALAAGDVRAAYAVIDVVEALGEFGDVRDVDVERAAKATALHKAWQQKARRSA